MFVTKNYVGVCEYRLFDPDLVKGYEPVVRVRVLEKVVSRKNLSDDE